MRHEYLKKANTIVHCTLYSPTDTFFYFKYLRSLSDLLADNRGDTVTPAIEASMHSLLVH